MIKVARWSIYPVKLAYSRPVHFAPGTETGVSLLVLRLVGDDGSEGASEIQVNPTWYGATFKTVKCALEELFLPLLSGLDDAEPASFQKHAAKIPENRAAKTSIINALWDLRATVRGQPLWRQWSGDGKADVSAMITRQAPDLMAAESAEMVERYGFRTLKFKGGQGIETDIAGIRAVRRALGDKVRIYVDVNGDNSPDIAAEYMARMADEGIVAVEDPYPLRPDRLFETVQSKSPIPILVDFYSASVSDAELFVERGLQALSLKPGRVGFSICRELSALGRQTGFRSHVGMTGESLAGSLAALQLQASLPDRHEWLPAEVTFYLIFKEQLLKQPVVITEGSIALSHGPSLAKLIDWDKVRRLAE